ncbi:MAG: hypothetical protein DMG49_02380 [Acidobacteria bacterium]|nr:MAG: hypothetical protein DMG49_02380 [Acidobacteriota bacterium]
MRNKPPLVGRGPQKRIVTVVKKSFGYHGGYLLVCNLECGHKVEHMNNDRFKAGRKTACPECR